MDGPANTIGYMIAGYAVVAVVTGAYLISLMVRFRNLKQDEDMLKDMEKKS